MRFTDKVFTTYHFTLIVIVEEAMKMRKRRCKIRE